MANEICLLSNALKTHFQLFIALNTPPILYIFHLVDDEIAPYFPLLLFQPQKRLFHKIELENIATASTLCSTLISVAASKALRFRHLIPF